MMSKYLFFVLFFFSVTSLAETYVAPVYDYWFSNAPHASTVQQACINYQQLIQSGTTQYTYSEPISSESPGYAECQVSRYYLNGTFSLYLTPVGHVSASCADGSTPSSQGCLVTSVTCPDGTTAPTLAQCPVICTAPNQVRNPTTNSCESVCTAGTPKALYVLSGSFPTNGIPNFVLRPNADGTQSVSMAKETVMFGGCSYDIPNSPTLGCSTDSTGKMYCKVTAIATGNKISGALDTAIDAASNVPNSPETCKSPLMWDIDHCAVPESKPGCYNVLAPGGSEEVCPSTAKKNCGIISGSEVCINGTLTSNGYPSTIVDGKVIEIKTNGNGQAQNCFIGNTQVTCINVPRVGCGPGTGFVCMTTVADPSSGLSPLTVPFSTDVQEKTVTTHTTNTDGTKTEVATTTNNLVDSTPTITTTEYDATGQETSTTTTQGTSTGSSSINSESKASTAVAGQAGTYSAQAGFTSGTSTGAAGGQGKFYTSSGKTVDSVGTAFMAKASNSPILKTGQDIFNVQFPQLSDCGNCDFSIPEVMGMSAVSMMPFCASWMPNFWAFIAAALKVATVFLAVRIMLTPTF